MSLTLKSSTLLARLGNSPKRRALVVLGVLLVLTLLATTGRAEIVGAAAPAYLDIQDEARRNLRGLWRGTFTKPWAWRRDHAGRHPDTN